MQRLYYDRTVRERLAACLDEKQPDVTFASLQERRQLERLDDHIILAEDEPVTADTPRLDLYGEPIPAGYRVIIDSDNNVYGSEPSFFASVWAPYDPFE